ncbi:MAG TPA: sensor domain-containing protein [Mycobacterium sp.]|nr:sensor domain-containing protein [Mycobacterium sp.]
MWKPGLVLVFGAVLTGCTQVVDTARPQAEPAVAPITAGQVRDLLSPSVGDVDGNLFATVEPQQCSGIAREVDPPFIFDLDPAATDGGHWSDAAGNGVVIEEMAGVYPVDFDARDALDRTRRTLESCRETPLRVTTMRDRTYVFRLGPPVESGSPDIVLWSLTATDWACDSAYVAAHNAAVGISTCGPVNGYDVLALASDALDRIEALANLTA